MGNSETKHSRGATGGGGKVWQEKDRGFGGNQNKGGSIRGEMIVLVCQGENGETKELCKWEIVRARFKGGGNWKLL